MRPAADLLTGPTSTQARERTRRAGLPGSFGAILRRWIERNRERAELAAMSARDFGDLAVPDSLIRSEVRRWPWQEPSPQWRALRVARRDSDLGEQ
jgi:uncharacterized protein YjiS (DUF1127 family)